MQGRKERIKELLLIEDRKRRLPDLLSGLSAIFEYEIEDSDVLTLEEIDIHRAKYNSTNFSLSYLQKSFVKNQEALLGEHLICLPMETGAVYLSLNKSNDIFVANVDLKIICDSFTKLIDFDGDTIYVCSRDYRNGFSVDLCNEYWFLNDKSQFLQTYELRVFGEDWIKRIVNYA